VARLAEQLTGRRWRGKHRAERSMEPADILIVTPYNAQIRAIQRALAASGQTGFRVGTVDKFQGQEAPAVIYSMATSSADEAPRGLDFLYDPHRLGGVLRPGAVWADSFVPSTRFPVWPLEGGVSWWKTSER
jgi:AAA domain